MCKSAAGFVWRDPTYPTLELLGMAANTGNGEAKGGESQESKESDGHGSKQIREGAAATRSSIGAELRGGDTILVRRRL